MARLPLTVYLARADLARLEARARSVGLARSALAGSAIKALLDGNEAGETMLAAQLRFLRFATEELIAAHPQSEAIRTRLAARLAPSPAPDSNRNDP
jgi:hypothetical protein